MSDSYKRRLRRSHATFIKEVKFADAAASSSSLNVKRRKVNSANSVAETSLAPDMEPASVPAENESQTTRSSESSNLISSISPSVSEIIEAESEYQSTSFLAAAFKRTISNESSLNPSLKVKSTHPLSPEVLNSFCQHYNQQIPNPIGTSTPKIKDFIIPLDNSMTVNISTSESFANMGFAESSITQDINKILDFINDIEETRLGLEMKRTKLEAARFDLEVSASTSLRQMLNNLLKKTKVGGGNETTAEADKLSVSK